LDAAGQCDASNSGFKGDLDILRRRWEARRVHHNRRLPVRFLSHLPIQSLNLSRLQPHGVQSVFRALTPFDPNRNNIGSHVIDARLVIEVLVEQKFQRSSQSQ
jgi:hypothetical protein